MKSNFIGSIVFIVFLSPLLSFAQTCRYTPSTWVSKKISYQERTNGRCEGFVKDKISATRFEVVGFTYGKFSYDSENAQTIYLQTPKNFGGELEIEATGIPFDLDYRMNAKIRGGKILDWNTADVLLEHERTEHYENVGVTGFIESSNGEKVYVPLRIVDNKHSDYLFFIIRSNGSLRSVKWKTDKDPGWTNLDGFFEKGDPVVFVPKSKAGIRSIEMEGVNDRGDLVTGEFRVQLQ